MRVTIEKHVRAVGLLPSEPLKAAYLNTLVGPVSTGSVTLTFRAELFTALRKAHAWPHHGVRESAFE